jgi:hypothetical protein
MHALVHPVCWVHVCEMEGGYRDVFQICVCMYFYVMLKIDAHSFRLSAKAPPYGMRKNRTKVANVVTICHKLTI